MGDLEATTKWVPGLVSTRIEGTRRVCRTYEGSEIVEEISGYSSKSKTWSYSQLQVPAPIRNSRGTLRVLPDGEGSLVTWESQFDPVSVGEEGNVIAMLSAYYAQALVSLRDFVEKG